MLSIEEAGTGEGAEMLDTGEDYAPATTATSSPTAAFPTTEATLSRLSMPTRSRLSHPMTLSSSKTMADCDHECVEWGGGGSADLIPAAAPNEWMGLRSELKDASVAAAPFHGEVGGNGVKPGFEMQVFDELLLRGKKAFGSDLGGAFQLLDDLPLTSSVLGNANSVLGDAGCV